jgi:hypothetical protein
MKTLRHAQEELPHQSNSENNVMYVMYVMYVPRKKNEGEEEAEEADQKRLKPNKGTTSTKKETVRKYAEVLETEEEANSEALNMASGENVELDEA